jgi:hypothetical protein
MTKKNKLIVGAVVVVLVAYYLYDKNKKMQEVEKMKAGAEVKPEAKPDAVATNTSRAKS